MKKKILNSLLLVFIFVTIHQSYWYFRYGGNFTIWCTNISDKNSINDVQIFLDDEKVFNEDISFFNKPSIYTIYPGTHKIKIICKSLGIGKEYSFNSFFVQRGIFEFYFSDEENKIDVSFHNENVINAMVFQ